MAAGVAFGHRWGGAVWVHLNSEITCCHKAKFHYAS